ncbi:hypothetical protein WMF30_10235 [Sorangium sp. So ce134]
MSDSERQRGRKAAVTWGGDTSGARQTALRILSSVGRVARAADGVQGFADGLRELAAEMDRIASEARDASTASWKPRPGEKVTREVDRLAGSSMESLAVERTMLSGEVISVESGAAWSATVKWWDPVRQVAIEEAHPASDFDHGSGLRRIRLVESVQEPAVTTVPPLRQEHFRGVIWPRGLYEGSYRYAVVGMLVTDSPVQGLFGNELVLNGAGNGVAAALASVPQAPAARKIGDANDVLTGLDTLVKVPGA